MTDGDFDKQKPLEARDVEFSGVSVKNSEGNTAQTRLLGSAQRNDQFKNSFGFESSRDTSRALHIKHSLRWQHKERQDNNRRLWMCSFSV